MVRWWYGVDLGRLGVTDQNCGASPPRGSGGFRSGGTRRGRGPDMSVAPPVKTGARRNAEVPTTECDYRGTRVKRKMPIFLSRLFFRR